MILVTGAAGFVGSHLCDFLVEKGLDVCGTYWKGDTFDNIEHLRNSVNFVECDITDKQRVEELIKKIKPEYIFHMAAQSYVVPSWQDPEETLITNFMGTFYLLEAIRKAGIKPKIIIACSSSEYGLTEENEIPINEKKEFRPSSPYAVSKIGTDMIAYLYQKAYKMKIIRIRFFNIIGSRKKFDVCADFAKGIAEIEKNKIEKLRIGNLNGIRDFTDIKDAIEAMWLLKDKGDFNEVYNVCSGKRYTVKEILDKLISLSKKEIKLQQDPQKIRIMDDPIFLGDSTKIKKLGWRTKVPIEKTLSDILDYWRNKVD
ncbi:MAG: GDP-mannose 4,6-dehydratase [Candidatus Aenigmarchaeota archaeon]|nr:GDP-mannose 4,6-dehydratase [Candidatus Aenigmarchaeota archaeon]